MTSEPPSANESSPPLQAPQGLASGRFSGPSEFAQCLRDALSQAAAQGWPWMVWSDPDFHDWPLGERLVVEQLNAWAHAGRHLRMLARRYDDVVRLHPRFVTWRQQWDHLIECRVCSHVPGLELPSVLWAPDHAVLRMDLERSIGWRGGERQRLVQIGAEVQECYQHGSVGFPATTLGL
ncbi:hypothetical protein RQP54_09105 [Curvibacter sp. APW13]|uniref:hypothetical protein n=1 Tax=Curvibacter sp. APW13 TaxID=3077236 RepID=UPI0028DDE662|nr:hypothetical protein [Curvibacter sp. APW13]MDT8991019.1 hypothetical protein [Curvibacter sp. APW13]